MSAFVAQARTELTLSLRQPEQLLVALGIPLVVLGFFSQVDILPTGTDEPIEFLAPTVLALAVMSSAMVSLGIATGFERYYGILKRLGVTPLGRPRLLGAKLTSVGLTEVGQVIAVMAVALLLGWDPSLDVAALVAALALGTVAFAGIGLLLAGTLPGPANLAACNGLYLLLLLFGGIAVPAEELPDALGSAAEVLPSAALSQTLFAATSGDADGGAWLTLIAWALGAPLVALATFRWDPA